MKIIYKTGDLLAAPERVICHGCNAQGKMGKGIAKQVREQEPAAYEFYMNAHAGAISRGEKFIPLGTAVWVMGEKHVIINAITQETYRKSYEPDGVRYADYDAIRKVMQQINATAKASQVQGAINYFGRIDTVAFPLIGAGLAGGSWKIISEIIEEESVDFQPVVYLFDGVMPTT
jgi:O-acetyl-ADP-ribose deacetylase (regulator of RNase III)